MRQGLIASIIGIIAVSVAVPAAADPPKRWERQHERRWDRDDARRYNNSVQRRQADAYRQGLRDGRRVNHDYRYDNRRPNYQPAYAYNRGHQNSYRWGRNGRVECRKSDGTTGTIVGALAGGTLGNVIAQQGDKTLGSIIGGTLGAVLGREMDRGNVSCR